jgi:hypothetical protein
MNSQGATNRSLHSASAIAAKKDGAITSQINLLNVALGDLESLVANTADAFSAAMTLAPDDRSNSE